MDDKKTNDTAREQDQLIREKRMEDMAVAPGEPDPKRGSKDDDDADQVPREKLKDADRDEENLEEGIEESMDASDPPSSTQP